MGGIGDNCPLEEGEGLRVGEFWPEGGRLSEKLQIWGFNAPGWPWGPSPLSQQQAFATLT